MIETSEDMTTYVEVNDRQPLFSDKSNRKCSKACYFLSVLGLLVIVGILMAGYSMYWNDVIGVRVMSLNTWGMPHTMSSEDPSQMFSCLILFQEDHPWKKI